MESDTKKTVVPVKLGYRILTAMSIGLFVGILEGVNIMVAKDTRFFTIVNIALFRALSGFFIATSSLKIGPMKRGILIAILTTLPAVARIEMIAKPMITGFMLVTSIIAGAIIGFVMGKMENRTVLK